ncbi:MAG TPA: LOG family protein [Acidobacteriota bacterium]|nr:LOG family protein [Acidobacteriota bacterium]
MARGNRRGRQPEIDNVILQLWNVIDDLEKLQPSTSRWFRVAMFGSSRISKGDSLYQTARHLAARLVGMGCDIVTGGGPGLMEAANEGAQEGDPTGKTKSYGLHIELPFEYHPNPYIDRLSNHRTFFSRLHHFVRLSHAYIVLPGGIGTVLEAFMVWQLLQVKYIQDRPLILLGDMWRDLLVWMKKEMEPRRLVGPNDLHIPQIVSTPDEAIAIVKSYKERFEASLTVAPGSNAGSGSPV